MEKNLIIDIKILKYDSSHNHPEKEYDVSLSIMKHKIKDGIEKKFNSMEYNDDIFVDGTFFIAPKFSYQIFITRTYAKESDTNEISVLIERYKNIETKLIDTKCDRNNTINFLSHQVLSKAVKVFEGGRCGKEIGICSDGYCCSKFGWCGDKDLHCKVEHDCQSNFWYLSRKI
ncbi:hypothetical protein H8356DRAFT_1418620 [Neocallimastix lanati (nom. inval.)]|nr:hypothetical protein H8356DRAFT_1418620 [Neocallimastix sp. JGI-2020a]